MSGKLQSAEGTEIKEYTVKEIIEDLSRHSTSEIKIMAAVIIAWHHCYDWQPVYNKLLDELRKEGMNNGKQ